MGNSDANQSLSLLFRGELLIELLDSVGTSDFKIISPYLRGGTDFSVFRKLVTDIWNDPHIVSVLCADHASSHP